MVEKNTDTGVEGAPPANQTAPTPALEQAVNITKGKDSSSYAKILAAVGFAFAAINMGLVWFIVFDAQEKLYTPLPKEIVNLSKFDNLQSEGDILPNKTGAAYFAMQIMAHHYNSTTRYDHILISFGIAFAIACFGVSLFMMGYDSAYQVDMQAGDGKGLKLTATAPGILCLVIACTIVMTGILKNVSYDLVPPEIATYSFTQNKSATSSNDQREMTKPANYDSAKDDILKKELGI